LSLNHPCAGQPSASSKEFGPVPFFEVNMALYHFIMPVEDTVVPLLAYAGASIDSKVELEQNHRKSIQITQLLPQALHSLDCELLIARKELEVSCSCNSN
jgi:hypothetical protein